MKSWRLGLRFLVFFGFVVLLPVQIDAASAPQKVVFTFGGLSERSGVLFVAKDVGIFQKHGLDAQLVNVRSGPGGMSALAYGESHFHDGSGPGRNPMAAGRR